MEGLLYPTAFTKLLDGSLDWTSASIKAAFLTDSFTYSQSDVYLSDIASSLIIASSDALTNPTYVSGLASGDPFQWLQLSDNKTVSQIVIYNDTGDPATSTLIAYYPEDCIDGTPLTLAGEDYFLYPVTPPGGFFKLTTVAQVGAINTYPLAGPYALAEGQGGTTTSVPCLYTGRRLVVSAHVCATPDEVESCCTPVIRSSKCA